MKKILSIVMGFLILLSTFPMLAPCSGQVESSEPPETEWSRTYGGTAVDQGWSVIQTDDCGYAVAGETWSFGQGQGDFWLVKTDRAGNMQWNQTYGGTAIDQAYSVVQTCDGGYAVAGFTESFGAGGYDSWLVKTDADGNMEWNQTYGGPNYDRTVSMVRTDDGGYALAGYTESFGAGNGDFWLVKTDADGNMEWNKTYGGPLQDSAYSVVQTCDGGYAIAGYTGSFNGPCDFWLVKTNLTGHEQWNKTYHNDHIDRAEALIETCDGGYAIAGVTGPSGLYRDMWLVKTNSTGHMQWNQTYGYPGRGNEYAYSVIQTCDGGYAIAGLTEIPAQGYHCDYWLVKTNSTGHMQWNKTNGGPLGDSANSVVQTFDGGYAIAGLTSFGAGSGDFWLIKIAADREPTKWAVVIGVDEYSISEMNSHGGAVNSAEDMYDVLVNYMGFSSDHVHLLVDEIGVSDDTVTEAIVEQELEWLQCVAIPEDIVVFYYAGHGAQDPGTGHESIVTHTMDYIQDNDFAAEINKIRSENLCVILDISHSGGFIRDGQTFLEGKEGVGGEWSDLADETPSGRLVLTACAENVTGKWHSGIPEDRDAIETNRFPWFRWQMVFTHYLVQGFRGHADSNNDGKVTVEEAFWYARPKANLIKGILFDPFRIHTGQTPMIYDGYPEYEGEGDLYLGD